MLGVRQACLGRPGRNELQHLRLDSPPAALRGHMGGVRRLRPIHMPRPNDHAPGHRAHRTRLLLEHPSHRRLYVYRFIPLAAALVGRQAACREVVQALLANAANPDFFRGISITTALGLCC